MAEATVYRGYRLNIQPHAGGWKVLVYGADRLVAGPAVPSTMISADRDACIAEAKLGIDNFFKSLSLSEDWPNC